MHCAVCVIFESRMPLLRYHSFEFSRLVSLPSLNLQSHTDPNEFNGVESYVSSLLFKTNVDWIPTRTSWRIEMDKKRGQVKNSTADAGRDSNYPLAEELARMRNDMENSQRTTQALVEQLWENVQQKPGRIREGNP